MNILLQNIGIFAKPYICEYNIINKDQYKINCGDSKNLLYNQIFNNCCNLTSINKWQALIHQNVTVFLQNSN